MKSTSIALALLIVASAHRPAAAAPNCGNMFAQMGGAAAGVVGQANQLNEVCTKNGWKSGPCLAQMAIVAQSLVWVWWTSSTWYCNCTKNPPQKYCAALGILPAPPAPPGAGGGGGLAPIGPAPPKPLAQANPVGDADVTFETTEAP